MRRLLGITCAVLCVGSLAMADPSLSYSTSGDEGHGATKLTIAAKDGSTDIWSMGIWVPLAGDNTAHSYKTAGEIISFKDLQHGGTAFDYSPELAKDGWSSGMMGFSDMVGQFATNPGAHFSYDTSHTNYFQFQWTSSGVIHLGSASNPLNTVDTVLTVRINAPTVSGGTFMTTLEANSAMTNHQTAALDTWFAGSTAGTMWMALTDSGTGAFVNPTAGTKPNVHAAGENPLYTVTDWYGSTDAQTIGPLVEAVVRDNADTAALNMRPGLTFRIDANAMDLYYTDPANSVPGYTDEKAAGYFVGLLPGQPGGLGSGVMIAPEQTLALHFTGFIGIIPEPATMILLAMGGLALLRRGRRSS